jgi:hypothetical protein
MVKRVFVVVVLLPISAGCVEDETKKAALAQAQAKQKSAEAQAKVNADAVATTNAEIKKANEIIKQLRKENAELKAALAQGQSAAKAKPVEDEPPPVELVTGENYNKLTQRMEYSHVAAILGPGKELSRTPQARTVQWRNYNGTVRITVNFDNIGVNVWADWLRSKSIYD